MEVCEGGQGGRGRWVVGKDERARGGLLAPAERARNFTRISETNFSGALRSRQAGVVNF